MINRQKFQGYIGIGISLCFIFFVVKQIDAVNIGKILQRTSVFWLFIALLFYWVEIMLRILRWKRILISVDSTIRYSSISNSFCISAAANNIFPFRFGDILRAHLTGIQRNISRFSLMGTIVLEKLIDVFAVLLLSCWGGFWGIELVRSHAQTETCSSNE
jgi:glycosyltransferase 2 family protein